MRAQRDHATDSLVNVNPGATHSVLARTGHRHGAGAMPQRGGVENETVSAPAHRFASIGIHAASEIAGRSEDTRAIGGSLPGAGGRTIVRHVSQRLSASIRRVRPAGDGRDWSVLRRPAWSGPLALPRRGDSIEEDAAPAAPDIAELLGMTQQAPTHAMREPAVGATVALPDITLLPQAALLRPDSIAAAFGYKPTVNKTGTVTGRRFGEELLNPCTLSGITVTPAPGSFSVAATVDEAITFQVRSSVGPRGQVDIASETDPDITADNYVQVADDLKPDLTNQKGKPRRSKFWAEDLTIKHERFHADEDVEFVRAAVVSAQAWLNAQTASSVADVNTHLTGIPAKIHNDAQAANPAPGYEERAYADGAPLYQARSDAIRARGAARKYGLTRGRKIGVGIGVGAFAGAVVGSMIGAAAGGLAGMAIGAGIGAVAGLVAGLIGGALG